MINITMFDKLLSLSDHSCLPVHDIDGDVVRCRWATASPYDECAGACKALSGSVLNEVRHLTIPLHNCINLSVYEECCLCVF